MTQPPSIHGRVTKPNTESEIMQTFSYVNCCLHEYISNIYSSVLSAGDVLYCTTTEHFRPHRGELAILFIYFLPKDK